MRDPRSCALQRKQKQLHFREQLAKEVKAHNEIATFDQLLGPILDRMSKKEQLDLLLFLRRLEPSLIDHKLKQRELIKIETEVTKDVT